MIFGHPLTNSFILKSGKSRYTMKIVSKGEAMNGLARALFFGKRGELRERGIQDHLQRG